MKFYLFTGLLLYLTGACQSQTPATLKENDSIPLDPAVRHGKLDNGFTYFLRKTDSRENTVRFDLVVKAGRDHEDSDQREYAHLLEHLLAKETKNFPQLKKYFYQEGRRRHAFTANRKTQYYASIPKDNKDVFSDGLQVLQDWANGNEWEPEPIAVERAAIEGEMKSIDPYREWKRNSIERLVLETMGYKAMDAQESLRSLKNFDSEAFYRFYRDWYRPDLQAAIIVGDINVDSLERVIREKFGALKGPPNPPDPQKYFDAQTVHFDEEVHFSTVTDSLEQELKLEVIRVRPNFELNPRSIVDYRNMLLQQLYMILLDKRAQNLKQQYDPPFSYLWANYRSGEMAGGQINATQMSLDLESDDLKKLKSEFQRGIKAWIQLHLEPDQTELGEAKKQLMDRYNHDKPLSAGQLAERYLDHFVDGKAAPSPQTEVELIKDLLKNTTVGDLQSFVNEKGNLDKDTHFIFFKEKNAELPPYEVFRQWIKEVEKMQVEPLKTPAPLIETLEDVVEITTSSTMKDVEVMENVVGVSTVELPNGIRLVLRPTPPAMDLYKNTVSMKAFRSNRVPLNNRKAYLAAQAAPEVMTFSGAGPYSKFDLERFVKEKQMSLRFKLDREHQLIEGKVKVGDLQEFLNLLYLFLEDPGSNPKAFEAWKAHKMDELKGKSRKSSSFTMEKITPLWYPQVPVMDMKDLEKLQANQVFQAVRQWFSSIENYTFIFTGDFETETLLPVLVKKLSGFPAKKEQIITSTRKWHFPLKKMRETLEYKNIDAAYVDLFFPIKVKRDLKTQAELQLLSKALNQRIWDRLREGSYSPFACGEWLDSENGIFAFRINFDSTPGDEEKMTTWALEEFRNLRENGVDEEWLKTAIAEESRTYERQFSTFSFFDFWQNYLQRKLKNGEDTEGEVLSYPTLLEYFISLKDINTAAKTSLTEENLQIFVGLPEDQSNLN